MNRWVLGEQHFNLLQLKMTMLKRLEAFCYSGILLYFSYHRLAKIVSERNLQCTKWYALFL